MIEQENLKKFALGENALKYIHQCLNDGKTFSKTLLSKRKISGDVFSFLPRGFDLNQISNFRESIFFESKVYSQNHCLDAINHEIKTFLSANSRNVCIFEDSILNKSDIIRRDPRISVIFSDNEVYYLLASEENQDKLIQKYIDEANFGWLFLCFFVTLDDKNGFFKSKDLSEADFIHLISGTKKIAVSAFDKEAYLFLELDQ